MKANCKNYEYLQFDDTKFLSIGIFLSAIFFPILFMGVSLSEYLEQPVYYIVKGTIYSSLMWFLLRYELIYLRKKFPKISQTLKRNLFLAGYGIVITGLICSLMGFIFGFIFDQLGVTIKGTGFNPLFIVYAYMLSLSIFAVYEAVYFGGKYKRAVEDRERLKTMNVQTELDNLRNQINPHFLFNSLNTLMNLIPKDPDRAMTYLNKLSKFYRYSVNQKDDTSVSITTEIKNAKIYADLLRERFGDNIEIEFKGYFPESAMILPMTLQLLIENAVKHNIVSKNKPLSVEIYPDLEGEYIYVKNNLQVKIQAVNSTGMGLRNIKERFSYLTEKKVRVNESNGSFEIAIPLIHSMVLA